MKLNSKGHVLPSVNNTPGYRKVAETIEGEILKGNLKVGDLLPIESDLAAQLGVNRSTIREGIRALENSGLLRRVEAKRLVIAAPDATMIARANSRAMGLNRVTFQELWELQMELEPFAAQLAAERINEDQSHRLLATIKELEDNLANDEAVIQHDIAFHNLIADATGNRALCLSAAPIGMLLFSATEDLYRNVPRARHRLLEAHRAIAEAIVRHDAPGARGWMAKHIQDFRRGYEAGGLPLDAPISFDARAFGQEHSSAASQH